MTGGWGNSLLRLQLTHDDMLAIIASPTQKQYIGVLNPFWFLLLLKVFIFSGISTFKNCDYTWIDSFVKRCIMIAYGEI